MVEKKRPAAGLNRWKDEIIAAGLLMAFAFFINRGIEIKGLYMDDLYLWSCYGEQSFRQFVLPLGSTRFRFIYYLAAWLELGGIGNHIGWFVPINIILNGCIAYTVYLFGKSFSKSWFMGFLCGIMYLLSRMSYYQIGQVYGLMESMALWVALVIFYLLYRCVNQKSGERACFIWANVLYFSICFIHERYMVLLPLFYLVLLLKKERKISRWLAPMGTFLMVQGVRLLTIGTLTPAGTGGTSVSDTFHISDAFRYAFSQLLYIFGINTGPSHLSGASWSESAAWVHAFVGLADIALFILVVLFLIRIIKDKECRKRYLSDTLLFFTFIALCIGSSSVTIRVETRWIYVSMTAAYLFAAYIFGAVTAQPEGDEESLKNKKQENRKKHGHQSMVLCGGLFLFYVILMFPVEQYYRDRYPNLYFWANQVRYNSLAEQTYEKYGEELFGKQIYIIGNSYEMSDFTARTFFKEFDQNRKAEGTEVYFIDSIHDIGLITNNMLVVKEDPAHNGYQDVTDFVRDLKCEAVYGYYDDGWLDESAKIRVMTGSSGIIKLELYYPGEITGTEVSRITLNGQIKRDIPIKESITTFELEAEPNQIAELTFENNFYLKDAKEQRGEKRFSMLINLTSE